jgi:formamidopyrimidine-DNA glycosylase
VKNLSDKKLEEICRAAGKVMQKSIDSGGSTMQTYVKADGSKGNYLEKFANVFRRDGQPCNRCQTTIVKTKVAGRGTHLCPKCQKLAQI